MCPSPRLLVLALALGCTHPQSSLGQAQEEAPMELEYRQIMLGPTCMGSWRVRVTAEGAIYGTRNTSDCAEGQLWSTPWPTDPTAVLSPQEREALTSRLELADFFDMDAHHTDPTKVTLGGFKEEVEVRQGERHNLVVAENVEVPEITAVRKALARYAR